MIGGWGVARQATAFPAARFSGLLRQPACWPNWGQAADAEGAVEKRRRKSWRKLAAGILCAQTPCGNGGDGEGMSKENIFSSWGTGPFYARRNRAVHDRQMAAGVHARNSSFRTRKSVWRTERLRAASKAAHVLTGETRALIHAATLSRFIRRRYPGPFERLAITESQGGLDFSTRRFGQLLRRKISPPARTRVRRRIREGKPFGKGPGPRHRRAVGPETWAAKNPIAIVVWAFVHRVIGARRWFIDRVLRRRGLWSAKKKRGLLAHPKIDMRGICFPGK